MNLQKSYNEGIITMQLFWFLISILILVMIYQQRKVSQQFDKRGKFLIKKQNDGQKESV